MRTLPTERMAVLQASPSTLNRSSSPQVSVVIPYYNEETRIREIIHTIQQSKLRTQIILVDDGSSCPAQQALGDIGGIELIRHETNQGKAAALRTGTLAARCEVLVFVDADLTGFQPFHLEMLVHVLLAGRLDMVVGQRTIDTPGANWIGFSAAYAGERAIRKKVLLENLHLFDVQGYLIEAALNKTFFKTFRVGRAIMEGVGQVDKTRKVGLVKGFVRNNLMTLEIIRFLGVPEFIHQLRVARSLRAYYGQDLRLVWTPDGRSAGR